MQDLANLGGFLGTGAPLLQDINLVVQLVFFIVLCLGVIAQRRGLYKWHDRLQTPVVVLNLVFIGLVMIPSARFVVNEIPARLSETYFLIPTVHIILGSLSEGLALYCMLAGFKILPRKIGVLRYFMWATFVFWTAAVIFGVGIYLIWYTGPPPAQETALIAEHDEDIAAEQPPDEQPADAQPAEADQPVAEHSEDVDAQAQPDDPTPTPAAEEATVGEHAETAPQPEAAPTDTPPPPLPTPVPVVHTPVAAETPVEPQATMPQARPQPAWQSLTAANAGPAPRFEQAMQYAAATNQVFVFGGRDGSQDFNDTWALDLNSLTWRELAINSPTRPSARHSSVMMVDDAAQNLYIATGQGPGGNTGDIWKLDLTTETWQDLSATAGPGPEPRYGGPGGSINNNLVLTHGFGSTRYDTTWQFNTQTEQWEEITPAGDLPLKRCLFAATTGSTSGNLIMHGGCASGFGDCYLDDTWVLDSNGWQQILSDIRPAGRQHQTLSAAGDGSMALLFGGQGADRAARSDLWALDLSIDAWFPLEVAGGPQARYNHTAAWVAGSGLLVFGGRDEARTPLADLWLLSLDPASLQPSEAPAPPPKEPQPVPTPTPELISTPEGPEHAADGG